MEENEQRAVRSIKRSNSWIKGMLTVSTIIFFLIVAVEVYVVANSVGDRAIHQNEVIYCVLLTPQEERTYATVDGCKSLHGVE